jgi:hypothetical protein
MSSVLFLNALLPFQPLTPCALATRKKCEEMMRRNRAGAERSSLSQRKSGVHDLDDLMHAELSTRSVQYRSIVVVHKVDQKQNKKHKL